MPPFTVNILAMMVGTPWRWERCVVDESMPGRLVDLHRRKIRVGCEEETMAVVGRLGVSSSDADSESSIYPSEEVYCAVRGMGLV
jgi:hypothetical protein